MKPVKIRNFGELCELSRQLASQPYIPPPAAPHVLTQLSYDDFRLIAFRPEKAIWLERDLPYRLEAFHKGFVHQDDVRLHVIADGNDSPIPFSRDFFQYRGKLKDIHLPDDLGFAGLRIAGQFPTRHDPQEMLTFLGASYFRGRALQHVYGASARGLALDVGTRKAEEFPAFREFWVVRPAPDAAQLRILALLDSPSVAGAYEFILHPGIESTDMDVTAVLNFRRIPEKVGIAPLTSMWIWGDGLAGPEGDHRPEVHDSDGLLIQSSSTDWTWRALSRQNYPSVMRFEVDALRGFGLIQRDTEFKHYRDDEAKYHLRPSVWVQPTGGDWGPGAVELLELPAPHEGIDNIAAWWISKQPVVVGEPVELKYRVSFLSGGPPEHELGKAVAMRIHRDTGQPLLKIEVDFRDLPAASISPDNPVPTVFAQTIRGELLSSSCHIGPDGTRIARLEISPTGEGPVELTVALVVDGKHQTETWKYLCPLEPPPVSLPPWRLKELAKESADD